MKLLLLIIGVCIFLFGLSWHFIQLFQTGTIFQLNDICELQKLIDAPPLELRTPQWMMEGSCYWLPIAVLISSASTSAGIVLIIGGFLVWKKKR